MSSALRLAEAFAALARPELVWSSWASSRHPPEQVSATGGVGVSVSPGTGEVGRSPSQPEGNAEALRGVQATLCSAGGGAGGQQRLELGTGGTGAFVCSEACALGRLHRVLTPTPYPQLRQ